MGINFDIKSYHEELERIKLKPPSLMENKVIIIKLLFEKEISFLFAFLTSDDYE
jgi:hypothetical protein